MPAFPPHAPIFFISTIDEKGHIHLPPHPMHPTHAARELNWPGIIKLQRPLVLSLLGAYVLVLCIFSPLFPSAPWGLLPHQIEVIYRPMNQIDTMYAINVCLPPRHAPRRLLRIPATSRLGTECRVA